MAAGVGTALAGAAPTDRQADRTELPCRTHPTAAPNRITADNEAAGSTATPSAKFRTKATITPTAVPRAAIGTAVASIAATSASTGAHTTRFTGVDATGMGVRTGPALIFGSAARTSSSRTKSRWIGMTTRSMWTNTTE